MNRYCFTWPYSHDWIENCPSSILYGFNLWQRLFGIKIGDYTHSYYYRAACAIQTSVGIFAHDALRWSRKAIRRKWHRLLFVCDIRATSPPTAEIIWQPKNINIVVKHISYMSNQNKKGKRSRMMGTIINVMQQHFSIEHSTWLHQLKTDRHGVNVWTVAPCIGDAGWIKSSQVNC